MALCVFSNLLFTCSRWTIFKELVNFSLGAYLNTWLKVLTPKQNLPINNPDKANINTPAQ